MNLTTGSRLGPYEIVSRIGAGGMGEVWRARDTRLERNVAIKVLSAQLAQNAQFKIRFEREAKTISQLSHPHICTLFDVGDNYLVMELLEGESLADRLAKGPLSLSDTLRYGAQIADALDRAHKAGVIHRDLKPGNVMITKSGAKLLDFGLAKSAAIEVNPDSPTVHAAPLTQEGTILGTFQYMAPEQLEGQEVDARTDIFALGALLYEMATGRRAFEGKTRTSLIAAIVASNPPPMSQTQALTPPALEHVVAKCLEKQPDERWQSAHDIAEELRWIASSSGVMERAVAPRRRLTERLVMLGLGLIAATAIALLVRERVKPPRPISFAIMAPRGQWFRAPEISPDGQAIVFETGTNSGERAITVRRVSSIDAQPLVKRTAAEGAGAPFWSGDGRWIGFWTNNEELMKVSVAGGEPQLICKKAGYGYGASWNESGTILFTPQYGEPIHRVAAAGGEAEPITKLDVQRGESVHAYPQFLADGDHYLFIVRKTAGEKNEIHAASVREGRKGFITKADSLVGVWRSRLFFVRDGAMYAQPFNTRTLKLSGEPHKILDGVWYSEDAATSKASISRDGEILYLPVSNAIRKHSAGWYDRAGRKVEDLFDETTISNLALSADESRIAVVKADLKKGADDIYVLDVARGIRTRITAGLANHREPMWAKSGDRIYFASDRNGFYDLYAQADDGATEAELIWKTPVDKNLYDLTPDGKYLIAGVDDPKTNNDIWIVPLAAGEKPRPFLATESKERGGSVSPDGKWIAYASDQSGRYEVYVRGFPTGRSVQVSVAGGAGAQWSHDGTEIFYLTEESNLMAVPIRVENGTARPGKPALLFQVPRLMSFPLASRRSDRFLIFQSTDPTEAVSVVHYTSGWAAQLGK